MKSIIVAESDDETLEKLAAEIDEELQKRKKIAVETAKLLDQISEATAQAKALAAITGSGWAEIYSGALPDELTDYIALGRISPSAASRLWRQPATPQQGYSRGETVIYEGKIYDSLVDENFYSPLASPNAWKLRI